MGLIPYKNEPYLDWSDEANVKAMRAAMQDVSGRLGEGHPLVIGGKRIETDGEIVSVNPANPSQVVGRVAAAGEREADMALETATKAFESWSRTAPEARARVLLRAAAIMRRRKFEMLAWEVYEGGKPWAEADAQFAEAIDFLEYYAREMLRLKDGVEIYAVPGEESRYFYQPMGVGVVIAPWNFPVAILTGDKRLQRLPQQQDAEDGGDRELEAAAVDEERVVGEDGGQHRTHEVQSRDLSP